MTTATLAAQQASPTQVDRIVSPSGIEIWHVESHVVPLVALAFTFEGGGAQDPEEQERRRPDDGAPPRRGRGPL
jgi:zinc protease